MSVNDLYFGIPFTYTDFGQGADGGSTWNAFGDDATVVGVGIVREPEITVERTRGESDTASCEIVVTNIDDDDENAVPKVGQHVNLQFGSDDPIFSGVIQRTNLTYDDRDENLRWRLDVGDFGYLADRRLPFACFDSVDASAAIEQLFDDFTDGSFDLFLASGLGDITAAFIGEQPFRDCLTEIANQVGAQFYFDGFDFHFFITPPTQPDDILEGSTKLLANPRASFTEDISQLRNRILGKGVSATIVKDVAVGDAVIYLDRDIFPNTGGGLAAGCQRFQYGSGGTVTTPVSRKQTTGSPGVLNGGAAGDEAGPVWGSGDYAFSFLTNGVESSLSAPFGGLGSRVNESISGTFSGGANGPGTGFMDAGSYAYYIAYLDAALSVIEYGARSNIFSTAPFGLNSVTMAVPYSNDPRVAFVRVYRSKVNNTSAPIVIYDIGETVPNIVAGPATFSFTDQKNDATISGGFTPVAQSPIFFNNFGFTNELNNITLGPTGTTARYIYRRVNLNSTTDADNVVFGTGEYKKIGTIPDNVTTIFTDDVPVSDDLSDVPGSLPPIVTIELHDVSGVTEAIPAGTKISMYLMRENTVSQILMATREGGDGIHEWPLVDESLTTYHDLQVVLDAHLQAYGFPIGSFRYSTLDPTRPGQTVHVDLPRVTGSVHGVFGDFLIQSVTIDQIHVSNDNVTRYNVVASSARFTLQDLLRKVRLTNDNQQAARLGSGGGGASGTQAAGVTSASGDVTFEGAGAVEATIADEAVTLAKMADLANHRVIGRDTAGSGVPESITIDQALDWIP